MRLRDHLGVPPWPEPAPRPSPMPPEDHPRHRWDPEPKPHPCVPPSLATLEREEVWTCGECWRRWFLFEDPLPRWVPGDRWPLEVMWLDAADAARRAAVGAPAPSPVRIVPPGQAVVKTDADPCPRRGGSGRHRWQATRRIIDQPCEWCGGTGAMTPVPLHFRVRTEVRGSAEGATTATSYVETWVDGDEPQPATVKQCAELVAAGVLKPMGVTDPPYLGVAQGTSSFTEGPQGFTFSNRSAEVR